LGCPRKRVKSRQSIYRDNNRQTIGIWDAFKVLEQAGIGVPERPVIELLIDDRNTIQHRFGFPNAESVYYYLQQVLAFFKRFFSAHYGVDLRETLLLHTSADNLRVVGLEQGKKEEVEALSELFEIAPESAVLHAWALLERRLDPYLSEDSAKGRRPVMMWHAANFRKILEMLRDAGLVEPAVMTQFQFLRTMRNRAAHSQHYESMPIDEWKKAVTIGERLLRAVQKAEEQGLLKAVPSASTEAPEQAPVDGAPAIS
jgi:uncharacterized protein YutE (UPF0331/DUF86 family)